MPFAFVSVKISTAARSGVAPNGARVTDAVSMTTAMAAAAGIASQLDEIGDPDGPLLVDAVADRDARQTRHRARARVGQLHVLRHVDLPEDQIAEPIVAAAVPLEH